MWFQIQVIFVIVLKTLLSPLFFKKNIKNNLSKFEENLY